MEIASSNTNPLIQQQAMQYSQTEGKQSQANSSSSTTQVSTPQSSLESAPQTESTIPGSSRLGGSVDTYA